MKNLFCLLTTFVLLSLLSSCGDDSDDSKSCTQADFVGTYTLNGSNACVADSTFTAPDSFLLAAGPSNNTLLEDGDEDLVLDIVECVASDDFVSYTIEGEQVTIQIGECSWSYTKI